MKQYADVLAFDRQGQLALIAEIKNKRGTSMQWASRMRRNMYAHGLMPDAPFFLLALPDRFYLWDNTHMEGVEPIQTVDPQPFLEPYYPKSGVSAQNAAGESFEFIIRTWLHQVLRAKSPDDLPVQGQDWLVNCGLFERLAGGYLEFQAAA